MLTMSADEKLYAIIGYDHRGCSYRYRNLLNVLQHYATDNRVHVLLVTNIADDSNIQSVPGLTVIAHRQQGAYSHNETLLKGLDYASAGAAVAFVDADIIFITGSLYSSVIHLQTHRLVSPLGVMHNTDAIGKWQDAGIPAGNLVGRKELLLELVQATGGNRIRGWGAEDVALLIAARQRGILVKRHYVETLHLWHPEAPKSNSNQVLEGACDILNLKRMDTREFRLHALQPECTPVGCFNAMRGMGSAHYLREICATDIPMDVHVLSDGRNDFLAQVHHAGLHIHQDNLPCERCANSDDIGAAIWAAHRQIASDIQSDPRNVLHNLWYATVALGWSLTSWHSVKFLIQTNNDDMQMLEFLGRRGLQIAFNQVSLGEASENK